MAETILEIYGPFTVPVEKGSGSSKRVDDIQLKAFWGDRSLKHGIIGVRVKTI